MISNLQIISGKYRGRKLALPNGARPTQNKARIALFNMLGQIISAPTTVWDAFAGSGAFGAEWLSRTDAHVIFTDNSADSFKTIGKNTADMPNKTIEMTDAIAAIPRHGPVADLIFIDPPYSAPELGYDFFCKLTPLAKTGTILVWEMDYNPSLAEPISAALVRAPGAGLIKLKMQIESGLVDLFNPPPPAQNSAGDPLRKGGGKSAWKLLRDKTYGRARFLILQKT